MSETDRARYCGIATPIAWHDNPLMVEPPKLTLSRDHCGDFEMRIAADGTWYHQGQPIRRLPLVKLFSTVLKRDAEGDYWLETPVERGRITVDDAPFIAVEMDVTGSGSDQILSFRTNVDDCVTAGPLHPLRVAINPETGEPRPYVLVRPGLEARLARSVFYQLADLCVEETLQGATALGVWSDTTFFPLELSTQTI